MKMSRWEKIEHLFQNALELSHEERAAFLKDSCLDDSTVCDEVESLLSSHGSRDDFLEVSEFDLGLKILARRSLMLKLN